MLYTRFRLRKASNKTAKEWEQTLQNCAAELITQLANQSEMVLNKTFPAARPEPHLQAIEKLDTLIERLHAGSWEEEK